MTVSPCPADFFVYNKELYQFLLSIQHNCRQNNCTKIASISLEVDLVDPLVVFKKMSKANQLNFYWENQANQEAIVAIDAVIKQENSGQGRFGKAEEFIQNAISKISKFALHNLSYTEPYFFCGFSFFHENEQLDYPFYPATIFLPRWQITVKKEQCILLANLIISPGIKITNLLQSLWEKINLINSFKDSYPIFIPQENKFRQAYVVGSEEFKISILSTLNKIQAKKIRKIVLANALDVISHREFDLFKSLDTLRQLHPNCYIFSTSNGKGQNFIGASPERLICISQKRLITDALAGSAPRGTTAIEDATYAESLLNSEKERHEHTLVIDFITQSLSQLGLSPQVLAPRLRQLSNIQHLWTPISAIVPANVHPLKIVAQLHPTPAVAGTLPDIACTEIRCYESFERGLYAAPLGWVDAQGNCEFIVGIRSALIDGNRARLYAGAGIVAGSDPDKELAEIQLKLQALLKALI
ncbi:MAG: isochorismate synthase [Calothrix sp. MO_167.B42]|nr:isochorismate synthase [Calothrix sp. MO_167.B42]